MIAIVLILALLPYSYKFIKFGLSGDTQDWANFGSYLGGVVGPFLAFFTIILIIQQINISRESTNEQIRFLQQTRDIDNTTQSLNHMSDLAFEIMTDIKPIPDINVRFLLNENIQSWVHDFDNKIIKLKHKNNEETVVHWSNRMIYLKEILNEKSESDLITTLREHPYNSDYKTLSSIIEHMVLYCYKLIEHDVSLSMTVRTKLSLFLEIVKLLHKSKYINDDTITDFYVLQSIFKPFSRSDAVELDDNFSQEINATQLFDREICKSKIECIYMIMEEREMSYLVKCNGIMVIRESGVWRKLVDGEEFKKSSLIRWSGNRGSSIYKSQ